VTLRRLLYADSAEPTNTDIVPTPTQLYYCDHWTLISWPATICHCNSEQYSVVATTPFSWNRKARELAHTTINSPERLLFLMKATLCIVCCIVTFYLLCTVLTAVCLFSNKELIAWLTAIFFVEYLSFPDVGVPCTYTETTLPSWRSFGHSSY